MQFSLVVFINFVKVLIDESMTVRVSVRGLRFILLSLSRFFQLTCFKHLNGDDVIGEHEISSIIGFWSDVKSLKLVIYVKSGILISAISSTSVYFLCSMVCGLESQGLIIRYSRSIEYDRKVYDQQGLMCVL